MAMAMQLAPGEGIEGRVFVVTGGAGFLGSALCLELILRGAAEVRSLDIRSSSPWLGSLRAKGVKCILGDIRRKEDVNRALKGANCVFHVASYGMSGKEMLQARLIDEVNLDGTCNVLDACVSYGVERLVYTSTYNVIFGGDSIVNGNEYLDYFPLEKHVDPYGRSKALAEQLVLKSNNRPLKNKDGRKLYTCAIRPAAIYGPEEVRHFVRILSMLKLGLPMFRIGNSNVKTDWVYIDNLVHAELLASMALLDDIPGRKGIPSGAGQAYFISDGCPINSFDLIDQVTRGLGYTFPQTVLNVRSALIISWLFWGIYSLFYPWIHKAWIPQPVILPAEVYKVGVTHHFSILKARQELGYVPLVSQKEGIERSRNFLRQQQEAQVLVPHYGWWLAIVTGMFALFCCAFVPRPWLGPFEWLRALGIFLHGSVNNLRIVFCLACVAHVLEATYAWFVAKEADPSNIRGWIIQTLILGFPSLKLLLKRSKKRKSK